MAKVLKVEGHLLLFITVQYNSSENGLENSTSY